jgi:hypothetical protein
MMTHPWDSNTASGRGLGVICYRDGVMSPETRLFQKEERDGRKAEIVNKGISPTRHVINAKHRKRCKSSSPAIVWSLVRYDYYDTAASNQFPLVTAI